MAIDNTAYKLCKYCTSCLNELANLNIDRHSDRRDKICQKYKVFVLDKTISIQDNCTAPDNYLFFCFWGSSYFHVSCERIYGGMSLS